MKFTADRPYADPDKAARRSAGDPQEALQDTSIVTRWIGTGSGRKSRFHAPRTPTAPQHREQTPWRPCCALHRGRFEGCK
jgi:hypothetical protein